MVGKTIMTLRHIAYFWVTVGFLTAMPSYGQDIVIKHVTLLDGTGSAPFVDVWVATEGDRIQAIGTGAAPSGKVEINGSGKFLIPGLIDAHVHVGGGRLRVAEGTDAEARHTAVVSSLHGYLYSGVTTVFDSGNLADFIFPLRQQERDNEIQSPRIYATGGVVTSLGGYGSGPGATVIGGENDLVVLDQHLDHQPDMVKILLDPQGRRGTPEAPIFTQDLLTKVVQRIHARGIRTTVHIPTEAEARLAIESGIDALAHLPARSDMSDEFVGYATARGIPMATTLAVFSNIARVADNPEMFDAPLYQATLTTADRVKRKTTERQRYMSSGMSSFFSGMLPAMQRNLYSLYQGGAILALGTDRSVGPATHQELRLLVDSGLPEADVIRIATLNAAAYLGLDSDLGSIEVGKLADMVLLSADPLEDIDNAQLISAVVKGGKVIDRQALQLPVNQ